MSRCFRISTSLPIRHFSNGAPSPGANRFAARLIPKRIMKVSDQSPNFEAKEKVEEISEAVQKYLQNYQQNVEFFEKKDKEFELGKRHLANIMGYDPDKLTAEQIEHAIQYLFPSGLFESQSRPVMRPPREIYPKFQKAYYDKSGRPFSSFFYTGFQNYYESLYELYANYEELNRLEDANNAAGIQPTEADRFDALTNVVLSKQQLEDLFVEKISDGRYESFVGHLNRLIDHPYSAQKAEFLKRFTKTKQIQMLREQLYTMGQDENGRVYSEAIGSRKNTQCKVRVYKDGTGKFLMNDRYDLNYFTYFLHREQILTPLVMADLVDKVDIYATLNPINLQTYFAQVEELDPKAQLTNAGTVRLGVSRALCAFVDDATKELLRVNGLLQPDLRTRERKKPGLYRARKKPPHRKR